MNQLIYTIIKAPSRDALIGQVNGAISDGWMPMGGAFFNSQGQWYQSMAQEVEIDVTMPETEDEHGTIEPA